MKIDRNNYQEWALDYIEGTLSKEKADAFALFLAENPDISAEVSDLQANMPVLPDTGHIVYPAKRTLLKKVPAAAEQTHGPDGTERAQGPGDAQEDGVTGSRRCAPPTPPVRPLRERVLSYLIGGVAAAVLIGGFAMLGGDGSDLPTEEKPVKIAQALQQPALAEESGLPGAALLGTLEAAESLAAPTETGTRNPERPKAGVGQPDIIKSTPASITGTGESEELLAPTVEDPVNEDAGAMVAQAMRKEPSEMSEDEYVEWVARQQEENFLGDPIHLQPSIPWDMAYQLPAVPAESGLRERGKFMQALRRGGSKLLEPLEIIPVARVYTNDMKGIEIASRIKITKKTQKE